MKHHLELIIVGVLFVTIGYSIASFGDTDNTESVRDVVQNLEFGKDQIGSV